MKTLQTIILTIGILMLIESLFVVFYPKTIKTLTKNTKKLKKAGIAELIVAIILIIISLFI